MSQYRLFRLWHIFREESNPDQRYNEGDKGKNGIEYCPAHRSCEMQIKFHLYDGQKQRF